MTATRQTAAGHLIAVQEQRFRLVTDTGQGLLLTLAHHAAVDENDLRPITVSTCQTFIFRLLSKYKNSCCRDVIDVCDFLL